MCRCTDGSRKVLFLKSTAEERLEGQNQLLVQPRIVRAQFSLPLQPATHSRFAPYNRKCLRKKILILINSKEFLMGILNSESSGNKVKREQRKAPVYPWSFSEQTWYS